MIKGSLEIPVVIPPNLGPITEIPEEPDECSLKIIFKTH
jgi:hypothetical protein